MTTSSTPKSRKVRALLRVYAKRDALQAKLDVKQEALLPLRHRILVLNNQIMQRHAALTGGQRGELERHRRAQ